MSTTMLLLLYLTGQVFARKPPDVNCMVEHLERVRCSWNNPDPSVVNYSLYGRFTFDPKEEECTMYVTENGNTACSFPYGEISNRFHTFHTRLIHGNKSFPKEHNGLKDKVKFRPPTNLSVKLGPDSNLWFYWNQTAANCVESEVRYRIRNRKFESSLVNIKQQNYCFHLPVYKHRYQLQVRSHMAKSCGGSLFWSEWCDPVAWGSNNTTEVKNSVPVWTVTVSVLGSVTVFLLLVMMLTTERLRVIFIPVIPKPLIPPDIESWLQISKGLKEGFKTSYNELACPVREFCPVSQSDLSTSCLSSDATVCVSSVEQ